MDEGRSVNRYIIVDWSNKSGILLHRIVNKASHDALNISKLLEERISNVLNKND
jgi:hypothetical protein